MGGEGLPRKERGERDTGEEGVGVANGVEMFVGQAAEQFRLFTGKEAPWELMTSVVEEALS